MSKGSAEDKVLKIIVDYMIDQNRPYSPIDVFNNLHQEYGKAQVVRCLELAAQSGDLKEKLVGKQKIYYPNQDKITACDDQQPKDIEQQIVELTTSINAEQAEFKALSAELKTLQSAETTEQLKESIDAMQAEISSMEKRLELLQSKGERINPAEKTRIIQTCEKYERELRTRKRIANDMVNSVLEHCSLKKKQLMDQMGMEADD